jgi:hypothetical protein
MILVACVVLLFIRIRNMRKSKPHECSHITVFKIFIFLKNHKWKLFEKTFTQREKINIKGKIKVKSLNFDRSIRGLQKFPHHITTYGPNARGLARLKQMFDLLRNSIIFECWNLFLWSEIWIDVSLRSCSCPRD